MEGEIVNKSKLKLKRPAKKLKQRKKRVLETNNDEEFLKKAHTSLEDSISNVDDQFISNRMENIVDFDSEKESVSGLNRFQSAGVVDCTSEVISGDNAIEMITSGEDFSKTKEPEFKNPLDIVYGFGDTGSSYRMRKLKRCLDAAKDQGVEPEEVFDKWYNSLNDFYIAKEEFSELEKRKLNSLYTMRKKPIGEFINKTDLIRIKIQIAKFEQQEKAVKSVSRVDLNRLKADAIKAKFKGDQETYDKLESQYSLIEYKNKIIESKNNAERLKEEELGTSIDKYNISSIKSITKDSNFKNDEDYMDEYGDKLSGSNTFTVYSNLKDIVDKKDKKPKSGLCIYCLENEVHINNDLCISIGEHCYIALNYPDSNIIPKTPESLMISPINHKRNSLELMSDEKSEKELLTFMTTISEYYKNLGFDSIFYESCTYSKNHAKIKAIPIPKNITNSLKGYFKNEIMFLSKGDTTEESSMGNESLLNDLNSNHKILIDTDFKNNSSRKTFKQLIAKQSNYFHVWLSLDGGYGHIIEDSSWPNNEDIIVKRVIGGLSGKNNLEIDKKKNDWKYVTGGTKNYADDEINGIGKDLETTQKKRIKKVNDVWIKFDPLIN